ncbi:hypothetical protein SD427_07355 [Chryseobacterium sp. JJR-5R]|uniref:hypothetical protein n=1 Tax=Chryseobacterium sp. JJR-5R TaxID=3093923 RepID=UPI002A764A56|nr:hypothetical protein [Chryseobacterium sp. JJR-5R]WPO84143.1 hypothetical protein SD427_07355 [Chryseobacterium sp. JJR-5R]
MLAKTYGSGTKNSNTDNGLYWNAENEKRYVFFAPDYDRLIDINSKNLSETCYWDLQNGMVSIGVEKCDSDRYFKEMGVKVTE